MSDTEDQPVAAPGSDLVAALRRARIAQAERTDARFELRAAELTRLEILRDALDPVFEQVAPEHRSLFDGGLVPGFPPRLWIDIVAFVELGRDQRTYRLIRESRDGRAVLRESADAAALAGAVTDYVAHRIIERERAFDPDHREGGLPRAGIPFAAMPARIAVSPPEPERSAGATADPVPQSAAAGAWAQPVLKPVPARRPFVTFLSGLFTGAAMLGIVVWAWLTIGNGRL